MIRTKINRTPSAILCSDFHLRENPPTCWVGDFDKEQWDSVLFVKELQETYNCPVYHAGDLFDHWKPSPWLLSMAIVHLPNNFWTVLGQHDIPQHNLQLYNKCGVNVLHIAGKLNVFDGGHWGTNPVRESCYIENKKVFVWHHLTYQKKPFPGAEGGMAGGILRKYPQFDLIVTGDNHQSFVEYYMVKDKVRTLVNPGSLTRQSANQIDFKPRVFLWYAETNTVKPVYIPIQEGVISREHIDKKEERNERIDAFVSRLNDDWDIGVSFEQNLEEFKKKNKVKDSIMEIIYKSIE